jgi:hypothetical protein
MKLAVLGTYGAAAVGAVHAKHLFEVLDGLELIGSGEP